LILDEPTNHLDMRSKDILKKALLHYDGTLIAVSHDREFLDNLVTKVFEFGHHKIKEYLGGIFDFLDRKKLTSLVELERKTSPGTMPAIPEGSFSKLAFRDKKDYEREVRKVENQITKVEQNIGDLEKEISTFEKKISDPMVDPDSITAPGFYDSYNKLQAELKQQISLWEKLHHELEQVKNKRN